MAAGRCPDSQFGQQPAAQLPWFHIVTLLTKLADPAEREWYATQAVAQGWSRTKLELNTKDLRRVKVDQEHQDVIAWEPE